MLARMLCRPANADLPVKLRQVWTPPPAPPGHKKTRYETVDVVFLSRSLTEMWVVCGGQEIQIPIRSALICSLRLISFCGELSRTGGGGAMDGPDVGGGFTPGGWGVCLLRDENTLSCPLRRHFLLSRSDDVAPALRSRGRGSASTSVSTQAESMGPMWRV